MCSAVEWWVEGVGLQVAVVQTDLQESQRMTVEQVLVLVCWYWCTGVLVLVCWYWCTRVLVYWYTGILVYWYTGVLVYWCAGVLTGAPGGAACAFCRSERFRPQPGDVVFAILWVDGCCPDSAATVSPSSRGRRAG